MQNQLKMAIAIVIIAFTMSKSAIAKDIAGVSVPDNVMLADNSELVLNGAGIRTKFFFDIYIGALYLKSKIRDPQVIFNDTNPKRMLIHFLHSKVAKDKITSGWTDGFENNNSSDEFKNLQERLTKFNGFFPDVKKGDEIVIDYVPEKGTLVNINGEFKGIIEGQDFNVALLKVWLGESPADSDLKQGVLGN